jgi:hypothetical protein
MSEGCHSEEMTAVSAEARSPPEPRQAPQDSGHIGSASGGSGTVNAFSRKEISV